MSDNKKPNIRFKGYSDDWEQRKLGEVCEIKDSARIPNSEWSESGVPYIRASDVTNENTDGVLFISQERYEFYKNRTGAPTKDDVLFNGGGEIGKSLLITDKKPIYVQGGAVLYAQTSKSRELVGQYLKTYFETTNAKSYVDTASAGGTMRHFTLKPSQMMRILMPSVEEQEKIGEYFANLDHLITLHQRKYNKLQTLKKAMLEKMFPKNGSNVPEIRFKGFTDAWEQRKVSDLSEKTFGGGTPKTSNDSFWKGNIPWIQSSDLVEGSLFDVEPRKYISQEAVDKSATKLVPEKSVAIVTRVGVGKLAFMPFPYATSQDFLSLSVLKTEPQFTVYALYKKLQSELNAVQGTSIKGVTKDELLAKEVMIPCYKEQEKIGSYLHFLDHLITLHQRELEKLQNIKKAMLEKMFV